MDDLWLPEGHHWDLHIEHDPSEDAGSFTGGGWKLCWHTTESPWLAVDAMVATVQAKRACPHFVIGRRSGLMHPVVVQLIPLDQAGRALQNFSADGFQTNRANTRRLREGGLRRAGRRTLVPGTRPRRVVHPPRRAQMERQPGHDASARVVRKPL
jgi:hypothetical protein